MIGVELLHGYIKRMFLVSYEAIPGIDGQHMSLTLLFSHFCYFYPQTTPLPIPPSTEIAFDHQKFETHLVCLSFSSDKYIME